MEPGDRKKVKAKTKIESNEDKPEEPNDEENVVKQEEKKTRGRYPRRSAPKKAVSSEMEDSDVDVDGSYNSNPASTEDESLVDDEISSEASSARGRTRGRARTRGRSNRNQVATRSKANKKKGANEEDEVPKPTRPRRTSSRSTKFTSSMKEPSGDSVKDLFKGVAKKPTIKNASQSGGSSRDESDVEDEDSDEEYGAEKRPSQPKKGQGGASRSARSTTKKRSGTANRRPAPRRKRKDEFSDSSDDGKYESDNDSNKGNALKLERIVASQTGTLQEWENICNKMNTTEITKGSRWVQNDELEKKTLQPGQLEERFLVKWAGYSYLHVSWETHQDLANLVENSRTAFTTFFRKSVNGYLFSADERCDGDYFDPALTQVDRILAVAYDGKMPRTPEEEDQCKPEDLGIALDPSSPEFRKGSGRQLMIKWCSSSYGDVTIEFEQDLIANDIEYKEQLKDFLRRSQKPTKAELSKQSKQGEDELRRTYLIFGDKTKLDEEKREAEVQKYRKQLEGHVYKNGGQLRDYQAEGVAWMMSNYVNDRSSILADEMGLGKTLQTAAFINNLVQKLHRKGPFLIVVPLSTIAHWQREFKAWTDLNSIIYHGSAEDRDVIRQNEFAFAIDRPNEVGVNQLYLKKCANKAKASLWQVQVVITTPEMLIADDSRELAAVKWDVLVVDEAHRLKNHNSKLAVTLRRPEFSFKYKILLTGTPIQNEVKEFWTLLNFIDPKEYGNQENFLEQYGDIKSKERIDELHERIRPYILRRLKEDVEKSVPPKEETLIEVELTILQKQYYRALYEKNVKFLHKNKKKALDGPSLNNLSMQLRKCCNHLFLLNGVEIELRQQEKNKDGFNEIDFLVRGSGKFVLLDKLLPRLKEKGHRILLFSQFKIMLDVLEDYLTLRKMKFERIDGSITGKKRQQAIDRFQNPDGNIKDPPFVMLLSTRAGGVGINLTAADTCIIFDSDWNPQNDLQAQARCHRIGQTKSVKVYRLLSRKSYEMQMFHMSSLKMGLDQAVLKGFESGSSGEPTMTKEEVERLLRHGAYDIFNEDKAGNAEAESNDFIQQDIDSILERRSRTVVHQDTGSGSNAAGGTFSKASFRAPQSSGAKASSSQEEIDIEDPDFWTKMVGEAPPEAAIDPLPRKRQRKNYSEKAYGKEIDQALRVSSSEGSDSESSATDNSSDDDEDEGAGSSNGERSKWGGSGLNIWKRQDANVVLSHLETHGYGDIDAATVKLINKERVISVPEIKRMRWSMVLLTLYENAQDDAAASKRRAIRAAEKRRESQNAGDGGVLAQVAPAVDEEQLLERSFQKLWTTHLVWATNVLNDAVEYAKANPPRSTAASRREKHARELDELFYSSLWPSLKGRGWKEEAIEHGKSFAYGTLRFNSLKAVLNAVPTIYPELRSMVFPILSAIEKSRQQDLDEENNAKAKFVDMNSTNINAADLYQFLLRFAPLQLITDRGSARKLAINRKILTACSCMFACKFIVLHATHEAENGKEYFDELLKILAAAGRTVLPHPLWTEKHDAILVSAIAKHGWIDREESCRLITNDSKIDWGPPFNYVGGKIDSSSSAATVEISDDTYQSFKSVAERAALFLNDHGDILEDIKGFDQEFVVQSYGLVERSFEDDEGQQTNEYVVDDKMLRQSMAAKIRGSGQDNDKDLVELDLPPKRDLVRRAKALILKSFTSLTLGNSSAGANAANAGADEDEANDYGLESLNLENRFYTLLREMISGILKASYQKTPKQVRLLCAIAAEEAEQLCDVKPLSLSNNTDKVPSPLSWANGVSDMAKIRSQVALVKKTLKSANRQSKNVLRVMLGIDVLPPRSENESLFPSLEVIKDEPTIPAVEATRKEVLRREDGALGERSINRAMKKALDKSLKEPLEFSSVDPAENLLPLTMIETLILVTFCSEGMPTFSANGGGGGYKSRGAECAVDWQAIGRMLQLAASDYHQEAIERLDKAQFSHRKSRDQDKPDSEEAASRKVDFAARLEAMRKSAAQQAVDYAAQPDKLAKKSIMLLERVRLLGTAQGTGPNKHSFKLENGLGPKIPGWFGKELSKWADLYTVVDGAGKPISLTTKDLLDRNPGYTYEGESVAALLDKKACRQVVNQIALLSRVRSLFVKHSEDEIKTRLLVAVKNSRKLEEVWEKKPEWWQDAVDNPSSEHDFVLLKKLAQHGFINVLADTSGFGPPDEEGTVVKASRDLGLTKAVMQCRANQLIRELHSIEESKEAIRLLQERRDRVYAKRRSNGGPEAPGPSSKKHSRGGVQTGLHAFFSSTKSASKKGNVVIQDADDTDIVKSNSPAKFSSTGKRKGEEQGSDKKSRTSSGDNNVASSPSSPPKKFKKLSIDDIVISSDKTEESGDAVTNKRKGGNEIDLTEDNNDSSPPEKKARPSSEIDMSLGLVKVGK